MASADDIRVEHPQDYGRVLVGAARFFSDCVQWAGAEPAAGMRIYAGGVFGFSGLANYTAQGIADNTWSWEEYTIVTGSNMLPGRQAPSMGHFFAPDDAKPFAVNGRYEAFVNQGQDIVRREVPLKGTGVADNESAPALLLDVEVVGGNKTNNDILVSQNETVRFKVTPRLDAGKLPGGVEPVEYVMIQFGVREDGTSCTGSRRSFKTRNETANSFTPGDYYQYLYAGDRYGVPASCSYSVRMLASIGKTFEVSATNVLDTGNGNVKYIFSIMGHYKNLNETRWPGSHATFSLRSSGERMTRTRISWPQLGVLSALKPSGESVQVPNLKAFGGIVAGTTVLAPGAPLKQGTQVNIGARLEVDNIYKGTEADILIGIGYQPNPVTPMEICFQTPIGEQVWHDGKIDSMGVRERTTLDSVHEFDIFSGSFDRGPGGYWIYCGYRTFNGALYFNAHPIHFSVTA